MIRYTRLDTWLCPIILVGDEAGISHLHLDTGQGKRRFEIALQWVRDDGFFTDAAGQIQEYFQGKRKTFDMHINPRGTDFQKIVWNELRNIPHGEVRTYGEIAQAIGREKSARAVGHANSKNPIPLIVPCHRVIGASGKLVGFAHGIGAKEKLLGFEKDTGTSVLVE